VIVETARGIEFGTVVSGAREVEDSKVVQPLKPVLRIASQRDVEQEQNNRVKEREAFKICLEKIRKHGLEMKLIDAEYTFDNNKVLFYFTADGRIDFRELVKDLAGVFKTRIELRQIGVRDETKILGGIGICGRPLCCHSYLSDFVPVSIKMAKEQNLSLNPTKISGVCGRLMCCLKNEEETYEELNRRLPNIGDLVTAEDGSKGVVQSVNVLRQLVKVIVEDGDEKEIHEYEVGQLHFKRKHTKKERMELSPEELAELERLEKVELEEIMEEDAENAADARRSAADSGKSRREEREGKGDRGNRGERSNRSDRGNRGDRGHQGSRGNRNDRSDRENRSGRDRDDNDRNGRDERDNRNDNGRRDKDGRDRRGNRRNRNSSGENQDVADLNQTAQGPGNDRPERSGQTGGDRSDRGGQAGGERSDRNGQGSGERRFRRDRRDRRPRSDKNTENGHNAGNTSEGE